MTTSSPATHGRLTIHGVELCVYLGWPDNERIDPQMVLLDMDIRLPSAPKACFTDHLDDTFCYSELITAIHHHMVNRAFHLIEHLALDIHQLIKPRLPHSCTLSVRITKHPKIQGLTGGVSFTYGDENASW